MENHRINVLLIENDLKGAALVREALGDTTNNGSFIIESSEGLSTGLERLSEGGIDVVLLATALPESRGLDTFKKADMDAWSAPFVVLAESDAEALGVAAMREGAKDYLIKGKLDGASLSRSLRDAIRKKRAEQGIRRSEERFRRVMYRSIGRLTEVPLALFLEGVRGDLWRTVVPYYCDGAPVGHACLRPGVHPHLGLFLLPLSVSPSPGERTGAYRVTR